MDEASGHREPPPPPPPFALSPDQPPTYAELFDLPASSLHNEVTNLFDEWFNQEAGASTQAAPQTVGEPVSDCPLLPSTLSMPLMPDARFPPVGDLDASYP